jgi:hypothetical protein
MAAEAPARPRRALGLRASMALVIGNMIGSDIFLLPALQWVECQQVIRLFTESLE